MKLADIQDLLTNYPVSIGGADHVIKFITKTSNAHYVITTFKGHAAEITYGQMNNLLEHGSCETLHGTFINLKHK